MRSMVLRVSDALVALLLVSMIGDDSAVTDTSSVTEASAIVRSMTRFLPSSRTVSVSLVGLKPCSVDVISYLPGGSAGKRYTPSAFVTAVLVPASGLRASTVAPGSTAPEASLTTP